MQILCSEKYKNIQYLSNDHEKKKKRFIIHTFITSQNKNILNVKMIKVCITNKVTTLTVMPCMPFSIRLSFRLPFRPWTESHVANCKTKKNRTETGQHYSSIHLQSFCLTSDLDSTVSAYHKTYFQMKQGIYIYRK